MATVAAVMQACYGMPGDYKNDVKITGKVLNHEGEPIPDIDITVNGDNVMKSHETGDFYFFFPLEDEYVIKFAGNEIYQGRDTTIVRDYRHVIQFDFKLQEK